MNIVILYIATMTQIIIVPIKIHANGIFNLWGTHLQLYINLRVQKRITIHYT